jgi:4-amino-4-deoxy-L-arabinose transferase-like glycosyltransferase
MFQNKKAFAGALTVALLAVATRLPVALRESFWHDECLTRKVALLPWSQWWSGYNATENSPPIYFILIKMSVGLFDGSWMGNPPAWRLPLRLPSLLASALAVLILWSGGRRHFGLLAGGTASLYLALNPWLIWYGAEARSYAFWTMALCGLLIATLDVSRKPQQEAAATSHPALLAALWTAWAALALLTHYFTVVLLAIASGFWMARIIFAPAKTPAGWRLWLISNAALLPLLGALVWLIKIHIGIEILGYITPANLKDLSRTFFVVMPFGLQAPLFGYILFVGAGGMIGLIVLACWRLGLGLRHMLRAEPWPAQGQAQEGWRDLLLLAWLILPPLAIFVISKFTQPIYIHNRHPIMSLPALALLVGATAQWIVDGWRAWDKADQNAFFQRLAWPLRFLGAATLLSLFVCATWQAIRYTWPERGTLQLDWIAISRDLIASGVNPSRPIYISDPRHVLPFIHNAPDVKWIVIKDREMLQKAINEGDVGYLGDPAQAPRFAKIGSSYILLN